MATNDRCGGMYMGFAEHLSDWELHELLFAAVTSNGQRITVDEFKRLRAEAKAKGYEVFPKEGCTNILPSGECGGHEVTRGQ